jgi:hypothetical protein
LNSLPILGVPILVSQIDSTLDSLFVISLQLAKIFPACPWRSSSGMPSFSSTALARLLTVLQPDPSPDPPTVAVSGIPDFSVLSGVVKGIRRLALTRLRKGLKNSKPVTAAITGGVVEIEMAPGWSLFFPGGS